MDERPLHAPLFAQFWRASEINPTRAEMLRESVESDATQDQQPVRPRFVHAAAPLPPASPVVSRPWAERRSVRQFSQRAVGLQQLSDLLWPLSARADGHRPLASGGGKYPLLVHVLALRVGAESPFVAWYDPQAHGLTRLPGPLVWAQLAPVLGIGGSMPAAVLVITAQPEGHFRKYGERGGRFALLEAGSYLGALQHETARDGLGGLVIGAYDDRRLLQILGPHAQGQLAMTAYAFGYEDP
ncbi:MAG: nitroreductase [Rhodoferax sp.]|nr:nitroreductase [Rhodoferax sp.]